jgi:hypothetical protein
MTTLFYKIPPNLPLTKGGIIPSLEKRGMGRFSDKCQFNYETLNNINHVITRMPLSNTFSYFIFLPFISLLYFSIPTHSFAAGHHSRQVGFISRDIVFPHPLHTISISSDHISETVSHQKHFIFSG